jgi:adenylylsulfate kinase-like enzyme
MVRDLVNQYEFIEVHISTPIDVCEDRDPKGLYKKARAGQIKNFTGIDSEYEEPASPEIIVNTAELDIDQCANLVIDYLKQKQMIFAFKE